jgi:hypothetical protein
MALSLIKDASNNDLVYAIRFHMPELRMSVRRCFDPIALP